MQRLRTWAVDISQLSVKVAAYFISSGRTWGGCVPDVREVYSHQCTRGSCWYMHGLSVLGNMPNVVTLCLLRNRHNDCMVRFNECIRKVDGIRQCC